DRNVTGVQTCALPIYKPWLIVEYFISPRFIQGAALTLWITIVSLFFGIVVGLIIALFQESKSRSLKAVAVGYLWFFRGTPALFQIGRASCRERVERSV